MKMHYLNTSEFLCLNIGGKNWNKFPTAIKIYLSGDLAPDETSSAGLLAVFNKYGIYLSSYRDKSEKMSLETKSLNRSKC